MWILASSVDTAEGLFKQVITRCFAWASVLDKRQVDVRSGFKFKFGGARGNMTKLYKLYKLYKLFKPYNASSILHKCVRALMLVSSISATLLIGLVFVIASLDGHDKVSLT